MNSLIVRRNSAAFVVVFVLPILSFGIGGFAQDNSKRNNSTQIGSVAVEDLSKSLQPPIEKPLTDSEMIQEIDRLILEKWKSEQVKEVRFASDQEFMRRLYLDITGIVPTVAQARSFLKSSRVDKRQSLIESLLKSPRFATHMATTWNNRILPPNMNQNPLQQNREALNRWLRNKFASNERFDNIVSDFLTTTGSVDQGPGIFYTALERKPEKLAANTARLFMGVQIQCAECHDHPFDSWTQKEFWEYAAFFAKIQGRADGNPANVYPSIRDYDYGDVKIPDSDETVAPRYPKGEIADPDDLGTLRQQLAIWMVSRNNPYMPRNTVNWAWSHFFGQGFVHPIDDFSKENKPSHPELLQKLSQFFVKSKFNLERLIRVIVSSKAYRLSGETTKEIADRPELFANMPAKVFTPEQLYDSLNLSMGRNSETVPPQQPFFRSQRSQFISKMRSLETDPKKYEGGLAQALLMMNGEFTTFSTNPEQGRLVASLSAPFFTDSQRIETMFLATYSRFPTKSESEFFQEYLQANSSKKKGNAKALGDLLWALINSAEFTINH